MSFKQNNPLSRKTSPINKNWIKGAIKRPGAFKKKAEEAGMSTKAFADKVIANKEDYDSRTDKQAELAKTLMGMSRHESGHVNPEQGDFDYEDPNYKEKLRTLIRFFWKIKILINSLNRIFEVLSEKGSHLL